MKRDSKTEKQRLPQHWPCNRRALSAFSISTEPPPDPSHAVCHPIHVTLGTEVLFRIAHCTETNQHAAGSSRDKALMPQGAEASAQGSQADTEVQDGDKDWVAGVTEEGPWCQGICLQGRSTVKTTLSSRH